MNAKGECKDDRRSLPNYLKPNHASRPKSEETAYKNNIKLMLLALSTRFSRQEYWRGLPFPSPGDLPNPGIEPPSLPSPALASGFFTTSATWEAHVTDTVYEITVKEMCELQSRSWQISCGTSRECESPRNRRICPQSSQLPTDSFRDVRRMIAHVLTHLSRHQ